MLEPALPNFYESIPENKIHTEANQPVIHPKDNNTEILPFASLGGRRFEILSYLLLRSDPRYEDAHITLVKTSGDEGRDLLVHRDGKLTSVIQCKNLEKPLDKPALIRELVKLALHEYRTPIIERHILEYQIWATGGFTAPSDNFIATWISNGWSLADIQKAFSSVTKQYKAFSGLSWENCREHLEQNFPKKIFITKLDGFDLTRRLRQDAPLFERFFTANVVMNKSDVETFFRKEGFRHITDVDIRLMLDSLEAFPSNYRHYIGSFVMGLTPRHYTLMTHEELQQFSFNCTRATIGNVSLLVKAITRHASDRLQIFTASMKFGSASFRYVLSQVITDRIIQKSSIFSVPSLPQTSIPLNEIKYLSLQELIERRIMCVWEDFELAKQQYNSDKHPRESDEWLRARLAYHALLGSKNREELENTLRLDFRANIDAIRAVDAELQALVPERLMVVGDTRTAFEDKELMDQFIRSVKDLDKDNLIQRDAENNHERESIKRGKPRLDKVTWVQLPYKDGAYFRGFENGLIFRGYNFSDELEITHRRIGKTFSVGRDDYFWQKPNILLPNYAEISTGGNDIESPLSWYGFEFCVRNSALDVSEWLAFDYLFDWEELHTELDQCEEHGRSLYAAGHFAEAVEPLRRAMVFSDRMLGETSERTISLRDIWNEALNSAALAQLRFRTGERVKITNAEHNGLQGVITTLFPRCFKAYQITLEGDDEAVIFASDDEVEGAND